MPVAHGICYSEWSDAQRATVKAEWAEKRRVWAHEHTVVVPSEDRAFPQTMDAQIWTREWMKTITEHPGIPTDEGTMLGWFANAIMAGWDEAMRRQEKERQAFL